MFPNGGFVVLEKKLFFYIVRSTWNSTYTHTHIENKHAETRVPCRSTGPFKLVFSNHCPSHTDRHTHVHGRLAARMESVSDQGHDVSADQMDTSPLQPLVLENKSGSTTLFCVIQTRNFTQGSVGFTLSWPFIEVRWALWDCCCPTTGQMGVGSVSAMLSMLQQQNVAAVGWVLQHQRWRWFSTFCSWKRNRCVCWLLPDGVEWRMTIMTLTYERS